MKTTIKLMFWVAILTLPYLGAAQQFGYLGYTGASDMDVNGVFIGGQYTKAQVMAKWGTPTQYRSSMSETGLDEVYDYSRNQFLFGENGIFHSFAITTSNFVVYTAKSGGIKVGDDVLRINKIGIGFPLLKENGTGTVPIGDDRFTFGHSDGIITWISFVSPI